MSRELDRNASTGGTRGAEPATPAHGGPQRANSDAAARVVSRLSAPGTGEVHSALIAAIPRDIVEEVATIQPQFWKDLLHRLASGGTATAEQVHQIEPIVLGEVTGRVTLNSRRGVMPADAAMRTWHSFTPAVRDAVLQHEFGQPPSPIALRLLWLVSPVERRPYVHHLLDPTAFDYFDADLMSRTAAIRNEFAPGDRPTFDARLAARPDWMRREAGEISDDIDEDAILPRNLTDPAELKRRFDTTTDLTQMRALAQRRFHIDFDQVPDYALRRLWTVLERLPPNDIAAAYRIVGSGLGTGGDWEINQERIHLEDGRMVFAADAISTSMPLVGGEAWFDQAARHEVGHAVDSVLGVSDTYGRTAGGGAWQEHPDATALARQLVATSGGPISRIADAGTKERVIGILAEFMMHGSALLTGALTQQILAPRIALEARDPMVALDPLISLIEVGTRTSTVLFGSYTGLPSLHGRCYYYNKHYEHWQSYAEEATHRKVSDYQFFSPKEWFAEAYQQFYAPGHGNNPAVDNGLKAKDPITSAYILEHVHRHTPAR